MYWFLILLLLGYVLADASAFTAAYSGWWGERGGKIATSVLRNFLSIPLWCIGLVMAYLQSAPALIVSGKFERRLGLDAYGSRICAGSVGTFGAGLEDSFPFNQRFFGPGRRLRLRAPPDLCRRATHAFRCDAVETDLDFCACLRARIRLAYRASALGGDRFVTAYSRIP